MRAYRNHIEHSDYSLGRMYEEGLGVDKNINEAIKRYTKAKEQGGGETEK